MLCFVIRNLCLGVGMCLNIDIVKFFVLRYLAVNSLVGLFLIMVIWVGDDMWFV